MEGKIIKPQDQANGEFDGGKIKEQKPIGFSGEGSLINRLGPLFYWAWGNSQEPAEIGLHPHQGFEIITYVIKGKAYHRDTLGTESVVAEGGTQLMQTGSGVYHGEALKEPSEAFQIWFEPHLSQAIKRKPTYSQYGSNEFSVSDKDGVKIKTILGNDSPMKLVTDAAMWDITIPNGTVYTHSLSSNRTLAGLAIRGDGAFSLDKNEPTRFAHKDFVIVQSGQGGEVAIQALDKDLRIFLIEVPTEVEYPLYRKPR
ncbi:pirin family protein [Priestia megaterium]|uniref:pirin family protein n=1 Tax=Priestia megaterium TaxID=1404 RepID=UPI002E1D7763|nr:pirin family protein [Priestia megaterium]MED4278653.1 pirin family protein [Priestia megaterium]MED4319082.1 pirin family protein [Priestia megaterium]